VYLRQPCNALRLLVLVCLPYPFSSDSVPGTPPSVFSTSCGPTIDRARRLHSTFDSISATEKEKRPQQRRRIKVDSNGGRDAVKGTQTKNTGTIQWVDCDENGEARAALSYAARVIFTQRLRESVTARASALLVRHGTRIALATTRRRTAFSTATGVSVLTVLRLLTTGHVLIASFATVLHVTASIILVGILRSVES
jgi:hypothetical protein